MGALIDGPVQRSRSVPHPRRSDLKQYPPAVPKFLWSLTTKADGDLESYDSMDDEVAPLDTLADHWFQAPHSPMMPARAKISTKALAEPALEARVGRSQSRRPVPPARSPKPRSSEAVELPPHPRSPDDVTNAQEPQDSTCPRMLSSSAELLVPLFVQVQRDRGLLRSASPAKIGKRVPAS